MRPLYSSGYKNVLCPLNDCDLKSYHGHYMIPGDPVPLARARYGNKKVWDSQKEIKVHAGILLSNQHGKAPRFCNALSVILRFYFPIPVSYSRKKRLEVENQPHYFKPDLSNLIKFVEDIGNDILYHDDARIAHIDAQKMYGDDPHTELIVIEL